MQTSVVRLALVGPGQFYQGSWKDSSADFSKSINYGVESQYARDRQGTYIVCMLGMLGSNQKPALISRNGKFFFEGGFIFISS